MVRITLFSFFVVALLQFVCGQRVETGNIGGLDFAFVEKKGSANAKTAILLMVYDGEETPLSSLVNLFGMGGPFFQGLRGNDACWCEHAHLLMFSSGYVVPTNALMEWMSMNPSYAENPLYVVGSSASGRFVPIDTALDGKIKGVLLLDVEVFDRNADEGANVCKSLRGMGLDCAATHVPVDQEDQLGEPESMGRIEKRLTSEEASKAVLIFLSGDWRRDPYSNPYSYAFQYVTYHGGYISHTTYLLPPYSGGTTTNGSTTTPYFATPGSPSTNSSKY